VKINELEEQLNEFTIALNYAADKTEQAVENLKSVKGIEIDLKEAAQLLKEQSDNLETRIAKTVTKEVLANLDEFFKNSKKIRDSAEAIYQAHINIQHIHQQSCRNRIVFAGLLCFMIGIALGIYY